MLEAEKNLGVRLTDTYAMYPAATVSGYYFAHPEAKYFNVGRVLPEQLEDYARRKGVAPELLRKIMPNNMVS